MCQISRIVQKSLTLLLIASSVEFVISKPDGSQLTVTVLHTNDVHSRFRQTNKYGGSCSEKEESENKCYGGFARLHHKVGDTNIF